MAWTNLAPVKKNVWPGAVASASVVVGKRIAPYISVILSAGLFKALGERTRAEVATDGRDRLRLTFADDGPFEVKRYGRGDGRVWVPLYEGLARRPEAGAVRSGRRAPTGQDG
jgi:hypothetical protein